MALVQPERAPRAGLCVPSGSSALDLATFSGLAARDRPLERGSIVRSRPRPPQTERAGGDHARAQPAHPLCRPRPQSCGRPARPAAFRPCRRSCRECARCRPALSGPSQRAKIRSEGMREALLGDFPPALPKRRNGYRPHPYQIASPLRVAMRSHAGKAQISGRQDLNLRPLGPQPSALPDCATPRGCSAFWRIGGPVAGWMASGARLGQTDGASERLERGPVRGRAVVAQR